MGLNTIVGADTVCEIEPAPYHRPHTNRTTASLIETLRSDDSLNHVGTGDVREMCALMVRRRDDSGWSSQQLVPGMEWDEAEAYCRWMNENDYPQRVYIGENVELGQGCRIEGATMIGDDAKLEDGVIVGDKAMIDNRADIGCGAVIEPQSIVDTRGAGRAGRHRPRGGRTRAIPQERVGVVAGPRIRSAGPRTGEGADGGRRRPRERPDTPRGNHALNGHPTPNPEGQDQSEREALGANALADLGRTNGRTTGGLARTTMDRPAL